MLQPAQCHLPNLTQDPAVHTLTTRVPCSARDRARLILFDVRRKPHLFLLLLLTKETTTAFASSPLELLTVTNLSGLNSVVLLTAAIGMRDPQLEAASHGV